MRIRWRARGGRKGFSVVEALILMIVLLVAIGAIFSTIAFTQRTLAFSREDRDSRELLFNWVQTFESKWPKSKNWDNTTALLNEADECIEETGREFNPSWSGNSGAINGFTVTVPRPSGVANGSMALSININTPGRSTPYVNLIRQYNIYTTDTVSDDSVRGGA